MPFRADEAARIGHEKIMHDLIPRPGAVTQLQLALAKEVVKKLLEECGPVVDSYPSWHPLVCNSDRRYRSPAIPDKSCGYNGLGFTRYFICGFITCCDGDGDDVINSVASLPSHPVAKITAMRLDDKLYHPATTPILVKCEWLRPLSQDGKIPLSIALPLILERELPCWRWASVAEHWDSMRTDVLGSPHGRLSSLFVTQETGQAIKKVWEALVSSGMFGKVST